MKPERAGSLTGFAAQGGQGRALPSAETGLLAGAVLLTLGGEVRAERLAVGDRVITRDSGAATITHLRQIRRPVRIVSVSAGALGRDRPNRDALLAGDQMVLIRDWRARALFNADRALIAARALIDGLFVTDLGQRECRLIQIFCDRPHILYADGMELGTADGARARGAMLRSA